MKSVRLLCIVLLFSSSLSVAQQASAPTDRPSREEVVALMETLHIRQMMVQMFEGAKAQMKTSAEAGFRYKLPNATPEQVAKVTSLFDESFSEINVDEMIDVIVPVYQQHVSRSDLQQIVAFYQSPVGQRLLAEQPAMMQESMAKSAELMQTKMPAIMKKLDEKMAKEFPELADKPPSQSSKAPAATHDPAPKK